MGKYKFLERKDILLGHCYLALAKHFNSEAEFTDWFNNIASNHKKNIFLKVTPYYLALVKQGDWHVNMPDSNDVIDYFTNTYKFIAIFSFIESLSNLHHIDFYQYLSCKKSNITFPLSKEELDKYYELYKTDYGAIKRCLGFFDLLSENRKKDLVSKLKVNGTDTASIENFAKYLYNLRSKFVHESKLIHQVSNSSWIGIEKNKTIRCTLSIPDAMLFFEEGLIIWCDKK